MPGNKAEEISVFGDDVDDAVLPEFRALHGYWAKIRGDRWAPPGPEFHLEDLPYEVVPWCVVVDVHREPLKFKYRFWGTRVVDLLGVDLSGKFSDDIPSQPYAARARAEYTEMLERKVAMYTDKPHLNDLNMEVRYQVLRVPFSTGEAVENILSVGGFSASRDVSKKLRLCWSNVRFWLLADIQPHSDLRPLYPRKRTFFITDVYVRF